MAVQSTLLDTDLVLDPNHDLVSSRLVEGSEVWSLNDGKLGTIHSLMIEKRSGRVVYALLSFGGFLGIAGRVHPVPWEMLRYDPKFDAYIVEISEAELRKAPTLRLDEADRPCSRDHDAQVAEYYGRSPWFAVDRSASAGGPA